MRILIVVFSSLISLAVSAQKQDSLHSDSAKRIGSKSPVSTGTTLIINDRHPASTAKVLIVMDGKIHNGGVETIDPNTIESFNILNGANGTSVYGPQAKNGVILITTKGDAKRAYQKKFSAFSREYQSYLENHDNNDDDILYVLNNDPIENKGDERISTLYKLSPEKIIGVTFTESATANGIVKKTVIIETKVNE